MNVLLHLRQYNISVEEVDFDQDYQITIQIDKGN